MRSVTFYDHPYPVWVIDQFLSDEVLDQVHDNWPTSVDGWHSGHEFINGKKNILEFGMRALSSKEFIPDFYLNLIDELNSDQYLDYYENLTGLTGLAMDQDYRWSGLREMSPGGYQLIHSDARQHIETGYTKTLTHLLYLNDANYDKSLHQGCLEIWNDDLSKCIHEIEPLNNRMVVFLNSSKSYHGVPNNNSHRKMITFSTLTKVQTTQRSKALFVSRKNIDSDEVAKLGASRALVEDKLGKI